MTISGSGMNAALSDYARFGQFVLDGGRIDGRSILPAGWRDEAGSPYQIDGRRIPYGYMWWVPELDDPILAGSFQAEGIYGQYIHINPTQNLVVVVASARAKPGYRRRLEIDDDAFFAAIARALS
jgi:CubicO group peptidase (beta-lactamase class C family)